MKNMILAKTTMIRALFALCLLVLLSGTANSQSWQLVWSDEFDGPTLNTSNWNLEVNDNGGGNNELQYYTSRSENVRIENQALVIEARKENYLTRNYTSGRLNSKNKKSWKYGKIEAKMKLPYGNGMWPAFWAMGNTGSWPACGEIDIMELVGGNQCGDCGDNRSHGYMWYSDGGNKSSGTEAPRLATGKYAYDYHIFGVEWNATTIKWFIDGKQFHSEDITASGKSEFHQPFYLLLNIAVGGDWPGSPNASTVFPQKMYVDYIRVYQESNCSVPAQPAPLSGNTSVASGSNQTYSVAAVSGATSYTWSLPSGWSGTSTTTSISTTVGSTGGTISVRANNACGSGTARTLAVIVSCNVPAQPGTISGNTSVASGSSQTYSISAIANTNSYTWTLPSGWSGTSTSPSITVTAGSISGIISVRANNACGSGTIRSLTVTINQPVQSPYGGTAWVIPGTIEAENYDLGGQNIAFNDLSAANEGGSYRTDAVDIEAVSGGGFNVGWISTNEWLEYTVNITATKNYKLDARVAAIAGGKTFRIEMDGATIGSFTVPNTGGWQNWQTITLNNIALTAGQKVMRIFATSTDFNVDKVIFSSETVNQAPSVNITSPTHNTSFNVPANITISANANDSDGSISKVEFFRGSIKIGEDATIPYSIIWTGATAGIYSITAKATDDKGDTTRSAVVSITVIGGTAQSPYGGTPWTIPGTIQAENYDLGGQGIAINELTSANEGGAYRNDAVDLEANTDDGGGYNVGWVLAGEWLEYTVNITTTGSYKLDLRVAAITSGKTFHVEMDEINISGVIAVPNTFGWNSWQTVTINNIALTAGQKIMRVVFDSQDLNLNYVTFSSITPMASQRSDEGMLTISSNPFVTTTTLNVIVKEAGEISVKVYDISGLLVKTIAQGNLNEGTHHFVLDATGLKNDLYIIKCITPNGSSSTRITKSE